MIFRRSGLRWFNRFANGKAEQLNFWPVVLEIHPELRQADARQNGLDVYFCKRPQKCAYFKGNHPIDSGRRPRCRRMRHFVL